MAGKVLTVTASPCSSEICATTILNTLISSTMLFILYWEKSERKLPLCQVLCVKSAGCNIHPMSGSVPVLEILCKFSQRLILAVNALSKALLISGGRCTED